MGNCFGISLHYTINKSYLNDKETPYWENTLINSARKENINDVEEVYLGDKKKFFSKKMIK